MDIIIPHDGALPSPCLASCHITLLTFQPASIADKGTGTPGGIKTTDTCDLQVFVLEKYFGLFSLSVAHGRMVNFAKCQELKCERILCTRSFGACRPH